MVLPHARPGRRPVSQQPAHESDDTFVDRLNVSRGVDQLHPIRLGAGQLSEAMGDASQELTSL